MDFKFIIYLFPSIIIGIFLLRYCILIIKNRHFRNIIKNKQVFKFLFEENEELLWSGKPYFKPNGILHNDKRFYPLISVISIIFSGIIYFSFILQNIFPSILVFSLIFLLIFVLIIIIALFPRAGLQLLTNTQYFITNKRVFSIRKKFKNGIENKEIVNFLFEDIEYFFFEQIRKSLPLVYNMHFKVFSESEKNIKNSILICRPLIDKRTKDIEIIIELDDVWTYKVPLELIVRFKRVIKKEEVSDLLNKKIEIKEGLVPIDWKTKYSIEDVHCPY